MKKFSLLICFIAFGIAGFSQNPVQDLKNAALAATPKGITDTSKNVWKTGGLISINISQGSQSNWAAGGDNFSMSATGLANAFAYLTRGKSIWDNNANLSYGYMNTTSQGTRISADAYDLTTDYGYSAGKKWYYTALADLRSQFSNGFLYPATGPAQFNSGFFSPAYLIVSLGIQYKPNDSLSVFISPITSRTTFVMNDSLSFYGKYGVNPGSHVLSQFGAYISANFIIPLNAILTYTGHVDVFSNYLKDPQDLDIYFTNLISAKLSKLLVATLAINLIYDNNVLFTDANGVMGPRLQFQELMAVGFSYKF